MKTPLAAVALLVSLAGGAQAQNLWPTYNVFIHRPATLLDPQTIAIFGRPGQLIDFSWPGQQSNTGWQVELSVLAWGALSFDLCDVGATLRLNSILAPGAWDESATMPPGGLVLVQPATTLTLNYNTRGAQDPEKGNDAWISYCVPKQIPHPDLLIYEPDCSASPCAGRDGPLFVFLVARITLIPN